MSISKVQIDGDLSAIKSCIDGTGLFGSTSISDGVLSICDANDVVQVKISNTSTNEWGFSVKLANGTFYDITPMTNVTINFAYTCVNGIMFNLTAPGSSSSSEYVPAILTLTNNNKYAVITNSSNGYSKNQNIVAVSNSDISTVNIFSYYRYSREFTTLVPFSTETGGEVSSYTPYAYFIPFVGLNTSGYARVIMNGCYYITDGYWAIKDEPA